MGVERIWRWHCEGCGAIAEVGDYGFPRGWIFVRENVLARQQTTHRCPACKDLVPKERRGIPEVRAEK